jgi:branched-chain amino acid aminotransferase
MAVSAQHNKIHTAIATWSWPSMFDPAAKMRGIRLDIAEYRRLIRPARQLRRRRPGST